MLLFQQISVQAKQHINQIQQYQDIADAEVKGKLILFVKKNKQNQACKKQPDSGESPLLNLTERKRQIKKTNWQKQVKPQDKDTRSQ